MSNHSILKRAQLLLHRLERISADSPWAHQASGIRASLAKCLARDDCRMADVIDLLALGFEVLEKAAGEIPETNGSGPGHKTDPEKS